MRLGLADNLEFEGYETAMANPEPFQDVWQYVRNDNGFVEVGKRVLCAAE